MSNHGHLGRSLLVNVEQVFSGIEVAVEVGIEGFELSSFPKLIETVFLRTSALINILAFPERKEPVLILNLDTLWFACKLPE